MLENLLETVHVALEFSYLQSGSLGLVGSKCRVFKKCFKSESLMDNFAKRTDQLTFELLP